MTKRLFIPLIIVLFLAGCATMPKMMNMVPVMQGAKFHHSDKTMKVGDILGGEKSDPLWEGSKIDAMTFKGALIISLQNSNLFTYANSDDNADYRLDVLLMIQDQPAFGLNMTVTLLARYTIIDESSGDVVWTKDINSSYTATVGDAFVGAVRVNKANEGAVRENIRQALNEISALQL